MSPSPEQRAVTVRVDGEIARVTLASPSTRNVLSRSLLDDLHRALDVATDAGIRVIVLDHLAPVFSAGADLHERAGGYVDSTSLVSAMERLMSAAQLTIAAVAGAVRAGGIGLMAACDLVVVHPDVSFAFTEVRVGVAPAIISVPILRRCTASSVAGPFLTGAPFSAAEALRIGLVTHVDAEPNECVQALIAGARRGAPGAVRATKDVLWSGRAASVHEQFVRMQELSDSLFRGDEGTEGMRAFLEHRAPRWAPSEST